MTTYKTAEDYVKCLQGKKLFLIGDSTLRQFIMHFTEGIKIVKYFRYHETGWGSWEKTLEALNMEKDIYISYKRHGFPLESFVFFYFMDDMYTSRQIDRQPGGKDTIFVITMGQHFRQFPLKLFIRRALNIRRAVERLFLRSPETKIIIKTENTRETNAPPERIGDFHGYTQYIVLREVFQGVNVGFVDAWDMTVASASETVHPSGHTFEGVATGLMCILGHSYVFWGARRAEVRPNGRQLGVPRSEAVVRWIGVPGMVWSVVVPEVTRFAELDRPPDVLVLHAGGNDLGQRSMRELIRDVKYDYLRLLEAFPGMIIVWSDVVARTAWQMAWSVDRVNKARIKVNKEVGRFVARNGGGGG
ncbi:PREDICTED: NXPE family member 1-like [Nanorana parkeri]|uniref:NXPE family member 1-like n=1 Tax=Nanorana parkeri TaxID=125878 RepID=UPI000854618A|nr:PREDICTED: NXPE family member 1-like [Nanorana parkeri]